MARLFRFPLLLLTVSVALAASVAKAQARPAAVKSEGISIFGGITRLSPAYSTDTNYGAMIGVDFTRYYRFFDPSIEIRYTDTSGGTVGESTIAGGLKLERRIGRFSPYGDVMAGYGSITFVHPVIYPTGPYSSDNSFIVQGGGGVDYRLTSAVALKADVQSQSWKIGDEDRRRSPWSVTLGVSVNLPFQGLRGRR